jgi:hypothetical protein
MPDVWDRGTSAPHSRTRAATTISPRTGARIYTTSGELLKVLSNKDILIVYHLRAVVLSQL